MSEEYLYVWNILLSEHFMLLTRPFFQEEFREWQCMCQVSHKAITTAFQSSVDEEGKPMFSVNFIYSHILCDHMVAQFF